MRQTAFEISSRRRGQSTWTRPATVTSDPTLGDHASLARVRIHLRVGAGRIDLVRIDIARRGAGCRRRPGRCATSRCRDWAIAVAVVEMVGRCFAVAGEEVGERQRRTSQ
mgnify:CR=1 FL=1